MSQFSMLLDPENPLFVLLFWENNPWKKVDKALFFSKLKPLSTARSFQEFQALFLEIEERASKSFAVRCLSKKSLFKAELVKKLKEKGVSIETISKTLAFCEGIGALNDEELLKNRMEKELRRGKSLYYAKAKWQKWAPNASLERDDLLEEERLEKEALLKWARKGKDRKDLFLFLRKKGFKTELIQEVLNSDLG